MKKIFINLVLLFLLNQGYSQNIVSTKTGIIQFNSKTSVEKIQAVNKKVVAVIDFASNRIEFALLIKGFEFEKALMQEHFNESYLESDKYPKAKFIGKFDAEKVAININEDKTQIVNISGNLTMHGITKPINTTATIATKNKVISATASITILLTDYNIKIPAINKNNVNNQVTITINLPNLQEKK